MDLLNNNLPFYIANISTTEDNDIISIDISTAEHGGCIEVHGDAENVLKRAIKILDALNEGLLP